MMSCVLNSRTTLTNVQTLTIVTTNTELRCSYGAAPLTYVVLSPPCPPCLPSAWVDETGTAAIAKTIVAVLRVVGERQSKIFLGSMVPR